jgi:hypothetical protein
MESILDKTHLSASSLSSGLPFSRALHTWNITNPAPIASAHLLMQVTVSALTRVDLSDKF